MQRDRNCWVCGGYFCGRDSKARKQKEAQAAEHTRHNPVPQIKKENANLSAYEPAEGYIPAERTAMQHKLISLSNLKHFLLSSQTQF